VVSLLLASVALPRLLRGLEVPPEDDAAQEEDRARHAAVSAAVEAVESAGRAHAGDPDAELHANAYGMVANLYRNRLRNIQLGDSNRPDVQAARDAEREYRLTALRAERDTILRLGRSREISDETARKLLREIDLVEARYRE
jgi:CPA1 family monovalent cation:H+ antiporter